MSVRVAPDRGTLSMGTVPMILKFFIIIIIIISVYIFHCSPGSAFNDKPVFLAGHPKMVKLEEVVLEHFHRFEAGNTTNSRISCFLSVTCLSLFFVFKILLWKKFKKEDPKSVCGSTKAKNRL